MAFLANIFGCAMYVSLILTPKIMEDSYDKLKIDRRVLARNSEVGGTLTSGMVPWSDNGIFYGWYFRCSNVLIRSVYVVKLRIVNFSSYLRIYRQIHLVCR